jgi:hypothetical protein
MPVKKASVSMEKTLLALGEINLPKSFAAETKAKDLDGLQTYFGKGKYSVANLTKALEKVLGKPAFKLLQLTSKADLGNKVAELAYAEWHAEALNATDFSLDEDDVVDLRLPAVVQAYVNVTKNAVPSTADVDDLVDLLNKCKIGQVYDIATSSYTDRAMKEAHIAKLKVKGDASVIKTLATKLAEGVEATMTTPTR